MLVVDTYGSYGADARFKDLLVSRINTISSVCSYWRRIALGTGQLWALIDFVRLRHADHVSLWLKRAGDCPLDIVRTQFDLPHLDKSSEAAIPSMLSRIKRLRFSLRSEARLPEQWIFNWCTNGVPRTLTTLELCSSNWDAAGFPPQGESLNEQHLKELFYSLDTLYLRSIWVNWGSLRCHNLVNLSLLDLKIAVDSLRDILTTNPKLQYIHLGRLFIDFSQLTAILPIQLHWLHTLHLERFTHSNSCQLLQMMAPGASKLSLNMDHDFVSIPDDESRRDFIEFCRRSHVTTLRCRSRHVLEDAIFAECKIEVLCVSHLILDNYIYDLIVPPIINNTVSPSEPPQPCLSRLHSLYLVGVELGHPERLRHILSAYPIHEIGVDLFCHTEGGRLSRIENLKDWVGPEIDISFVVKEWRSYAPFDSQ